MRGSVVVMALLAVGCGGASVLPLARLTWRPTELARSDAAHTPYRVTQRFDAPVRDVVLQPGRTCVLLDAGVIECWGTRGVSSRRRMMAARRSRTDVGVPVSAIELDHERLCAHAEDGTTRCLDTDGWQTLEPPEPEPEDADGEGPTSWTFELLETELTGGRCELTGPQIDCTFPLPGDDVVCVNGHEGEPCSSVTPHEPVHRVASADVTEASVRQATLCAALVDGRFECWWLPGQLFDLMPAARERDVTPVALGVLEGVGVPEWGAGRACGVHQADPAQLTCIGLGPVGAESFVGALGSPVDPWRRGFVGASGRPATESEAAADGPGASCSGGWTWTCDVDPGDAVTWARPGATRVSFDGANRCDLTADGTLRCTPGDGAAFTMGEVREHAAGVGTLYWVDGSGRAWCAGNNVDVQCQDDGPREVTVPHRIAVPEVAHLSAGERHACAVTTDGAVWCWGANGDLQVTGATMLDEHGALAASTEALERMLADAPAYTSPTEVMPPGSAIDVACGAYTTCVLRMDGASVCW